MDPVSIVGFIGASAKVAFDVGNTLYQFASAAKDVEITFKGLAAEADGVSNSLKALEKTLRAPSVRSLHGASRKKQDMEVWHSVQGSVVDCRRTLLQLQQALADSKPPGSTMVQRWIGQFKLQLKADDIANLRNQLQTHRTSLHTSLLMMDVYATSITSNLMLTELLPRINELQESMDMLTRQQKLVASSNSALPNVPLLEKEAKRVISSALTICEERSATSAKSNSSEVGNTTGSELGDPLDPSAVRRIATWASNAPTLVRGSLSSQGTTAYGSPPLLARGSVGSMYRYTIPDVDLQEEDEEDEDDFMLDHVRKYLREGDIHHQAKEYLDAEDCFLRALQKAKPLNPQQQGRLDLDAVYLMLGMISLELREYDKAETRLLPIADNDHPVTHRSIAGYRDAQRRYEACHLLAQIYMQRNDLTAAEAYCLKALQGRYKMRTSEPTIFYPTAKLMAEISTAKGDHKEAQMFADMVPEEPEQPEAAIATSLQPSLRSSLQPSLEPATARSSTHDHHLEPQMLPEPSLGIETESMTSLSENSIIILPSRPFTQTPENEDGPYRRPRKTNTNMSSLSSDRSDSGTHIVPVSEDPLTLSTLIQNNFDPNAKNFDPDEALYWAAKSGEEHILRQLIRGFGVLYGQKKAKTRLVKARNIDMINAEGFTPLMVAASRGHTGTVRILMAFKSKVNMKMKLDRRTAMHLAALRGHGSVVQALIDGGAEIDAPDSMSNNPLHLAASRGETDMVALLINAGANRESKTASGCTPLHLAVLGRQEEVVGTLLHHGAKVDTALAPPLASPHATPTAVTALASESDSGPPIPPLQQPCALHLAATNGDTRILSLLLLPAFGADIEIRTADGRTPLMTACLAGQPPAVSLLLEKGSNLESRDVYGRTALSFVAGMGALVQTPSPIALQRSVTKSKFGSVTSRSTTLTSNSSRPMSPTSPSHDDSTPVHLLLLALLLRNGASTSNQESDGSSPLHVAAFEGDHPAVRLLIQHGADATMERAGGLTPRDLAKKMGFKDITKTLSDAEKGKICGKDKEEQTRNPKSKSRILGLGMGRKLTA